MNSEAFLQKLEAISDVDFLHDPKENTRIGVKMGDIFKLAKQSVGMSLNEVEKLLRHDVHEARVGAASILDFIARDKKTTEKHHKEIYDLYINNHDYINTWDLVDRAAPYVVGGYLFNKSRAPLYDLAKSGKPMERRTAITATYFFIRQNDTDDKFKIAAMLAGDSEKFVQTAVGSWLREAGKRDEVRLISFLKHYKENLSAIALRYAMEKLSPQQKENIKSQ